MLCGFAWGTLPLAGGPSGAFLGGSSLRARPVASATSRLSTRRTALVASVFFSSGGKQVSVTGGTGFVGRRLVRRLVDDGNRVTLLTRRPERAMRLFGQQVDTQLFDAASASTAPEPQLVQLMGRSDAVVNLAGEPLATGRWTQQRKEQLLRSRTHGTHKLVRAIQAANKKPAVLVSTSAVGYYGTSEVAEFDESSPPGGHDFLSQVATEWERAAEGAGVRTVINRFGIVLGPGGGALSRLIPLYNLFVGGPVGTGQQWVSWIHLDDLVQLICTELGNTSFAGVYNATSPHPVRFREFCDALGRALGRPSWLPVPAFAVEAILGEAALLVLKGQRVLPKRTLASGFEFRLPYIDEAMREVARQAAGAMALR